MAADFIDDLTGNAFSIQLQAGRPDTGKFDYTVSSQGDYLGTATLSDKGHGVIALSDSSDADYIPVAGEPASQVGFRLDGVIVQPDNALSLDMWIDGRQVYFHTGKADPGLATAVAQQAVATLSAKNWDVFYGLLAPEAQVSFKSKQDFARSMNAANANVASVRLAGTASLSSAMGYSYFSQTVLLTEQDSSGIKNYKTTLYLVYETGRWYILGTDPPVLAP